MIFSMFLALHLGLLQIQVWDNLQSARSSYSHFVNFWTSWKFISSFALVSKYVPTYGPKRMTKCHFIDGILGLNVELIWCIKLRWWLIQPWKGGNTGQRWCYKLLFSGQTAPVIKLLLELLPTRQKSYYFQGAYLKIEGLMQHLLANLSKNTETG